MMKDQSQERNVTEQSKTHLIILNSLQKLFKIVDIMQLFWSG